VERGGLRWDDTTTGARKTGVKEGGGEVGISLSVKTVPAIGGGVVCPCMSA
jgi:hypothetical protein